MILAWASLFKHHKFTHVACSCLQTWHGHNSWQAQGMLIFMHAEMQDDASWRLNPLTAGAAYIRLWIASARHNFKWEKIQIE